MIELIRRCSGYGFLGFLVALLSFLGNGLLFSCLFFTNGVYAADVETRRPVFSMAFWSNPDDEPILKFAQLFYTDALARLGYELKPEIIPPARIGYHVKRGEVDGDPGRVWEYGDQFPELLRISVPLIEVDISAFSLEGNIQVTGFEQLALGDTKVDYILGTRYSEAVLTGLVPKERLTHSSNAESALHKLHIGRSDVFIHSLIFVAPLLLEQNFAAMNIQVNTLHMQFVYPYLAPKHASLVAPLTRVIKEMHQAKITQQYLDETINLFRAPNIQQFDADLINLSK